MYFSTLSETPNWLALFEESFKYYCHTFGKKASASKIKSSFYVVSYGLSIVGKPNSVSFDCANVSIANWPAFEICCLYSLNQFIFAGYPGLKDVSNSIKSLSTW